MRTITSIVSVFVTCLAGLSPVRGAGFGDLGPYFSFTYGDGGGIPADVNNVTGQQTSPDGRSVKLFGDLGPIDGARFHSGFVLDWTGEFQGPINPGDKFVADLSFNVQVTGGTLAWSLFADLWSNEGFEQARILTSLMPMPASGQINGAHFESSPFTQPGETGRFEGYVHVDWTGFSPTDTLTMTIPGNSADFTYMPVPEPGAFPLLLSAFMLARFRRSKRGQANGVGRSDCPGQ